MKQDVRRMLSSACSPQAHLAPTRLLRSRNAMPASASVHSLLTRMQTPPLNHDCLRRAICFSCATGPLRRDASAPW